MTMYPIETTNLVLKVIFYFWRCVCILFLSMLCVQLTLDVLSREEIELIEVTDNIINIGRYNNFFFKFVTEFLFCAGLFVAAIIRVIYFYAFQGKIKLIAENGEMFKTESEKGVYKTTIKKWIMKTNIFCYLWYFNLFFTVEFMAFLPLFFMSKTER